MRGILIVAVEWEGSMEGPRLRSGWLTVGRETAANKSGYVVGRLYQ
jgi:hypothetical protein